MKKTILIIATLGISFSGMAQDKYVTSAREDIGKQDFDNAKEDIDKAMASPETKEKPKALLTKAQIYMQLQAVDKYKSSNPYKEATQTLFKLAEVKPDYERATVDQLFLISTSYHYNDGVKTYNDKKYADASELMKTVINIHDLDDGKRFAKIVNPKLDTLLASAYQVMANCAYFTGQYEEAIPILVKVKSNPITRTPSVYECLIDSYHRLKNSTDELATIEEGRKAFPDDVTIRNYELNYYIISGKQDEVVKKLEEAAIKEPKNADIQFNIATTYLQMANPKDAPAPANAAELSQKAEDAFKRTIVLAPDNPDYNYNFGALYFNQATTFNNQMNAITGTSDADQKKYDNLKVQRDALFAKATPYFEKAYDVLSKNEKDLRGDEKQIYKSTLLALKEVYARQNKLDKSAEMKKKYEAL